MPLRASRAQTLSAMPDRDDTLFASREVLTPSQLNRRARELVEGEFASVWIEGEISNFARPASGHVYFTLKDAQAQVRCAMFRPRATLLRFRPTDGMRVLARAKASVYEGRGEFQLIVEHMEEAGEGALRREFERLKARLAAEGLFETARKRALPRFVRSLGVITSPSGAAVRDVVSVLSRRFPLARVHVLAVPVQGAEAPGLISAMLRAAGASGRFDVLLLTRGGGSLEDLWAFNDEALARAIFASPVPVVSAVGHEIDFTIADFVADLRAPTPSAAAELLVPDALELARELQRQRQRLAQAFARGMRERAQRVDLLQARLGAMRPDQRLRMLRVRADALAPRLARCMGQVIASRRRSAEVLAARLRLHHPRTAIARLAVELGRHRSALAAVMPRLLERDRRRLDGIAQALHAVSPLATLQRGYTLLIDPANGAVVRSVAQVRPGDGIEARLADGALALKVREVVSTPRTE